MQQRAHFRSEVFRGEDLVAWKCARGQRHRIEPLKRGVFDRTVVKIEPINVEKCLQAAPSFSGAGPENMQGQAPKNLPRVLPPKRTGEM